MSIVQDIRHSIRLLRRTPGPTAVALGSIAITVGATAVVFTAVKTVLLDPLPYRQANRLFAFRTDYAHGGDPHEDWVAWPDIQDVMRNTRSFETIGTYNYALVNITGDANSPPEAYYGLSVSANMFPMLGVKPMLGRSIRPEENQAGRDHELILSYGLWKHRFNGDRNVVGRTIEVNGHSCTIIGVMPPDFDFPMHLATPIRTPSGHMDFWVPQVIDPKRFTRDGASMGAVGRLRAGVSPAQAAQEIASISAVLQRQYPVTNQDRSLRPVSLRDRTLGFASTGLPLLMAAALMFLLIGCANVANLVLARVLSRHREIAVRAALGAGGPRIVRQLVTESCVLGLAGGLLGYALTVLAWKLLPAVAPVSIPRLDTARADWTVFAFTLAVSIVNSLIFGIVPALGASRRDPAAALREGGSRSSVGGARNRLRSSLVIAEVAIAVVLVVIGGLLTASFIQLLRTDPGFDTDHVLASIVVAAGDQYRTPESREPLFRRIVTAVRALPEVHSAGTADALPFSGENHGGYLGTDEGIAQSPGRGLVAEIDCVSSDYLQTMGIRLLAGRWFREDDMAAPRDTAIVSSLAAAHLWPGQSALGKKVCINWGDGKALCKQVVGVVGPALHARLDEPAGAQLYFASTAYQHVNFLVVRSSRVSADLARSIRMAVASADPKQPVFLSATMSTLIGYTIADRRFIMTVLAITGGLALLLAAAGIYGVVSYATSLRTQEIGLRMALGAAPRQVHALIFGHGMRLTLAGVGIGLTSALVLVRLLRNILVGLASADPAFTSLAVVLVVVTAAIACLIPARRATRIDPMSALRM